MTLINRTTNFLINIVLFFIILHFVCDHREHRRRLHSYESKYTNKEKKCTTENINAYKTATGDFFLYKKAI